MPIRPRKKSCPTCGGAGKVVYFDGSDLRAAREGADVSLREMARRGECSVAYLSDVELGRRNVTESILALYREVLGE